MAFIDGTVVNVALPALQAAFHTTVVDMQWIVESYGLFSGSAYPCRRIARRPVRAQADFSVGCDHIRSGFRGMRICIEYPTVNHCKKRSGLWCRASRARQPRNHQHLLRREKPRQGNRHMVRVHCDYKCAGATSRRLAHRACFLALGVLYQCSAGGDHDWYFTLAYNRKPRCCARKCRLVGRLASPHSDSGGLVYAFIESENVGWGHPLIFVSMIMGCVFLGLFILIETRVQSPIVPLALFRSSSFSGANLLTLFLYGAMGIFFFLFPLNLIQVQRSTPQPPPAPLCCPLILLIFLLSRWSGGLVARYGSQLPLIIGPLVAASGFILSALPSIGCVYWKSFSLGVVVLGFGMAITVAPLTTVVMNSVGQDRVGAASGINNAVARIAGVLAIAVLGIVMVKAFGVYLDRSLVHLSLPTRILEEIQSNETSLAALQPPDGLDPKIRINVTQSIEGAFVFGFRIIMGLCAALSLAGSFTAWLIIPDRSESSS